MKSQNLGLLILRLTIGVLLIFHGISKISNGVGWIVEMFSEKGIPGFFAYAVYIGEVIAPLMLIFGIRTRFAALLIIANFLVVMFIAHPEQVLALTENGAWALEKPGLFLFASLTLFFTGGGKYGVSSRNRWD